MKRITVHTTIAVLLFALLMTVLCGCGRKSNEAESTAPAEAPAAEAESGRSDGERFEDIIVIEGMEETVRYEHIINDALGFELDYDYESLTRRSEAGRECFISIYDDPSAPENYLEVTCSPRDAETVAAAVSETLSRDYDIIRETCVLDRAGSCIRIDASEAKDGGGTPDLLQMVYIIPAADGSRIATAHYGFESSEGFGRRFSYIMHSLIVIGRNADGLLLDEEALSAVRNYCYLSDPELDSIVKAGEYPVYWDIASSGDQEIVVLFRSYTGALVRYYIDRTTGDAYVTEFVPGITSEEERTGESFNVRDHL